VNLDLAGRVVVVSGSSRGIGRGIAEALLREDALCVLNGRGADQLEVTRRELEARFPDRVRAVAGDVGEPETMRRLLSETLDNWGAIDGVVANAGALKPVPEVDIAGDDWDWYWHHNFIPAACLAQACVPALTRSKGAIVIVGSIAGKEDFGAPLPYQSAKAALAMYGKSLSRRLAPSQIRVNVVSPGNILFPDGNWDRRQASDPEAVASMLADKVPLRVLGRPEDVAAIVVFLLSGKAQFITGANIVVDGGQTVAAS